MLATYGLVEVSVVSKERERERMERGSRNKDVLETGGVLNVWDRMTSVAFNEATNCVLTSFW